MDEKEFSIEEMKTAADDIKKLRPVQEVIMVALKLRSWEEIPVLKWEGWDIDHAEFQDFLKRLKSRVNEGNSTDGKIHKSSDQFTKRLENSVNVTGYLFFNDPFKAS